MKLVEGRAIREIRRLTGYHRDTIRAALASDRPPRYERPPRASKLNPFLATIEELLDDQPTLSGVRIREELEKLGYDGGKTILDDLLRELRPRYLPPPRSFQRTVYRPGELAQFDLCEPRSPVPVGWGQTRRGFVVTCKLPYSRAFAGALVFSKEWADIAWGMRRCLGELGALPRKLVWDREGGIHAGGGRPTEAFAGFCGQLALGWIILDPGDCQAKGALERDHRFLHGNFEVGRSFANQLDFQAQLDAWSAKINGRVHRTTRAVVSERLASERERMRPLPAELPDCAHRFVVRVPPQPYVENGNPIWPHRGNLIWPHPVRSTAHRRGLTGAREGGRGRDGIKGGAVRTDPARPRSRGALDPRPRRAPRRSPAHRPSGALVGAAA